jgi:hypothetical protein
MSDLTTWWCSCRAGTWQNFEGLNPVGPFPSQHLFVWVIKYLEPSSPSMRLDSFIETSNLWVTPFSKNLNSIFHTLVRKEKTLSCYLVARKTNYKLYIQFKLQRKLKNVLLLFCTTWSWHDSYDIFSSVSHPTEYSQKLFNDWHDIDPNEAFFSPSLLLCPFGPNLTGSFVVSPIFF